eukprot:6491249-Amphidinium_carterae.4
MMVSKSRWENQVYNKDQSCCWPYCSIENGSRLAPFTALATILNGIKSLICFVMPFCMWSSAVCDNARQRFFGASRCHSTSLLGVRFAEFCFVPYPLSRSAPGLYAFYSTLLQTCCGVMRPVPRIESTIAALIAARHPAPSEVVQEARSVAKQLCLLVSATPVHRCRPCGEWETATSDRQGPVLHLLDCGARLQKDRKIVAKSLLEDKRLPSGVCPAVEKILQASGARDTLRVETLCSVFIKLHSAGSSRTCCRAAFASALNVLVADVESRCLSQNPFARTGEGLGTQPRGQKRRRRIDKDLRLGACFRMVTAKQFKSALSAVASGVLDMSATSAWRHEHLMCVQYIMQGEGNRDAEETRQITLGFDESTCHEATMVGYLWNASSHRTWKSVLHGFSRSGRASFEVDMSVAEIVEWYNAQTDSSGDQRNRSSRVSLSGGCLQLLRALCHSLEVDRAMFQYAVPDGVPS